MKTLLANWLMFRAWIMSFIDTNWNIFTRRFRVELKERYELASDIRDYPEDGLVAHFNRISYGIERGIRILKDLKAIGYVTVYHKQNRRNPASRPGLIASVTPAGHKFLKQYEARKRKS